MVFSGQLKMFFPVASWHAKSYIPYIIQFCFFKRLQFNNRRLSEIYRLAVMKIYFQWFSKISRKEPPNNLPMGYINYILEYYQTSEVLN